MKLKKGSAAAKAFMAKIRAKRKKVSGVKETNKIKKAAKKLKVTLPHGYATTKGKVRVSGVKKAATKRASLHKDTASHNVRISVVSGVKTLAQIMKQGKEQFFRSWEDVHNRKGLYQVKLSMVKTIREKNEIKKHIKQLNTILNEYKKIAKTHYSK
jgi:hypothetical protein